jgi:outer membrane lipoprotein-sorting protein
MTTLAVLTALSIAAQPAPRINDFVSTGLRDATMVATVVRGDQRELQKINNDFGQSYRFKSTKIQFKEPFKIRLEASAEDTSILYVLNGATQIIRVPRARINTRQDLSNAPGRRQTTMDFGVLTSSLFNNFFTATFVRQDRATGAAVFDIRYVPALDDTSRHRVWIDPERKYVMRREWYNQVDRQLATFVYEQPKQFSGVWMPTQMTVRNVENKVAGITRYESIAVNTGLAESLFDVN